MSEGASVILQTRVLAEGQDAFAAWAGEIGEALARQPGFVGQEVIAPNPPVQVDWFLIQRFKDEASASRWLQSEALSQHLQRVESYFAGNDTISLSRDRAEERAAFVTILCHVDEDKETDFLAWQRKVMGREAKYPGFMGHRLERPVPGVQDKWVVILTFQNDDCLDAWMNSEDRKKLIQEAETFQEDVQIKKTSYGFDFWYRNADGAPSGPSIFKSNLIVLLVLYPIVFLWGYFVSGPFIEKEIPFWAALFLANLMSTQLMGWWVVPKAFQVLDWWLKPRLSVERNLLGYGLMVVLYAASMAFYAWLLSRV